MEKDKNIDTIYLSAFWSKSISGRLGDEGVNWRLAALPNEDDILSFLDYGREFLRAAQKNDRRVIFMHDIPILDFDIKRCFDSRPFRITENKKLIKECSLKFSNYLTKNEVYFKTIRTLLNEFTNVEVYDPKELFCETNKCKGVINHKPIYYNGDHVNEYGADLILNDMKSKDLL